jgi:16S rRNA (cytosine1402-N4)-methyltransferase
MTTTPDPSHIPVLLEPILARAKGAKRVVDATLGHGGHAAALIAQGATLLGIDRDPLAIAIARQHLGDSPTTFLQSPYAAEVALQAIRDFRPDFALLDLGVSSQQFDDASRGFTFRAGAPLDMRMGPDITTAADWLNTEPEAEIARVMHEFADEPKARRLAGEIVRRRGNVPFGSSDDLVNAVRAVLGPRSGPGDFARIFQAVRIAVNDELGGLARALPVFRDALSAGGTLAVISYHSGEDRLVKRAFREWSTGCTCPAEFPQCVCHHLALGESMPRKAVVPSDAEIASNPRARSARLRFFRRADEA